MQAWQRILEGHGKSAASSKTPVTSVGEDSRSIGSEAGIGYAKHRKTAYQLIEITHTAHGTHAHAKDVRFFVQQRRGDEGVWDARDTQPFDQAMCVLLIGKSAGLYVKILGRQLGGARQFIGFPGGEDA